MQQPTLAFDDGDGADEESSTAVRRVRPDRRAARRIPIELDVRGEGGAYRFVATTANLSPSGVFVATMTPLAPRTEVFLEIALPSGATLAMLGVVEWRRVSHDRVDRSAERTSANASVGPAGLALSFFCPTPEVRQLLEEFCAVREALYCGDGGDAAIDTRSSAG
jgi:hypothetical protein